MVSPESAKVFGATPKKGFGKLLVSSLSVAGWGYVIFRSVDRFAVAPAKIWACAACEILFEAVGGGVL
jgi:hypothetical protein